MKFIYLGVVLLFSLLQFILSLAKSTLVLQQILFNIVHLHHW